MSFSWATAASLLCISLPDRCGKPDHNWNQLLKVNDLWTKFSFTLFFRLFFILSLFLCVRVRVYVLNNLLIYKILWSRNIHLKNYYITNFLLLLFQLTFMNWTIKKNMGQRNKSSPTRSSNPGSPLYNKGMCHQWWWYIW